MHALLNARTDGQNHGAKQTENENRESMTFHKTQGFWKLHSKNPHEKGRGGWTFSTKIEAATAIWKANNLGGIAQGS